jgi:hypothetical protein
MRGQVVFHHYMDVGHDWAKHHAALVALLGGLVLAIVVVAVTESTISLVQDFLDRSARIESTVAYPAQELPREWRWEHDAISFDHMYREGGAAGAELEWIRDPGRRAR